MVLAPLRVFIGCKGSFQQIASGFRVPDSCEFRDPAGSL